MESGLGFGIHDDTIKFVGPWIKAEVSFSAVTCPLGFNLSGVFCNQYLFKANEPNEFREFYL